MANFADGNGAQLQNYYLQKGYDIFAIDMTGCGQSTGNGIKSLFESKYCVSSAVKLIQENEKTKDLPIFLMGHSWGGYGVVAATDEIDGVSAVASFSGYNMPSDMMYYFAENYTSKAIAITKPAMEFGVSCLWGKNAYVTAESAIKNNLDISYVIIHGDNDDVVPLNGASIYSHVKEDGYDNVEYQLIEGMNHDAPWKTLSAMEYTNQYEEDLKKLRKQYNNQLPEEIRQEYLASIDLEKSSALNEPLLDYIDDIFTSCL